MPTINVSTVVLLVFISCFLLLSCMVVVQAILLHKTRRQFNLLKKTADVAVELENSKSKMRASFKQSIENEEFVLYYQPKICAVTNKVVGAEALIRWMHPTKGCIMPGDFIHDAEDSGMIIPLGVWILRTACLALKQMQTVGLSNLTIAVNFSSYQFNHGDIAENIAEILWNTGIKPASLELELTESLLMSNTEKTVLMLRVLKTMGMKISVDDFGTGYSSLSHLRNFPIDILKIDQSFIRNMHKNPANIAIVTAIISMAKQLNLKVVAEGVESQAEVDLLLKEGCDYLQGYFYSVPVPLEKFIEFAKQRV